VTDPSTSLSEEHLASPSVSPDYERDLMTLVATWHSSSYDLLSWLGHVGSSGKTSPASCQAAEDETLVPSSPRWGTSGMGGPTESWTLSTSEFPSVVVESSLSDILETGDVPPRFFLSHRACEGILRRAAARGFKLPPTLAVALRAVVGQPK